MSRTSVEILLVLVVISIFFGDHAGVGAVPSRAKRFEFNEIHMSTRFSFVLYADDRKLASAASRNAFDRIATL
ncbi:MAG TPA: hypothetical protein VFV34_17300, partial [Blastocatellia bacterium]|nr:hypothetical protein [Blastocatellia bacterium]